MTLGVLVNWVAGALLAMTIAYYLFIYTMWLKRKTPQNIVIGGAAGAFPPMIGWAAVTGSVSSGKRRAVPDHLHVDASALLGAGAVPLPRLRARRRADAAGREGPAETRRQIVIYSWLLVPLATLPAFMGFAGPLYLVAAVVLGCDVPCTTRTKCAA